MGVTLAAGSDPATLGVGQPEARLSWLPASPSSALEAPASASASVAPAPAPTATSASASTATSTSTSAAATQQHELTVLATVAHELRGPLTALATSSELLAEDFSSGRLDPEQIQTMLAAMHRRTVWLQGLVENLLTSATIREGRLKLHREPLRLSDLLADVEAVVGPLLAQRGQRVRIRQAAGVPIVQADSRRLGQVLVNLILNASKFGAPNSAIDVTISRRAGGVRVAVADRGPGIAAEDAARLFEPFYRSPKTASTSKEGVGLGLSIVKSIVEAHGGRVGADSRKGGGASFWFVIPTSATTKAHLSIVS